ncbi:hypothetical protein AMTR_s00014p00255380 [Amborella trichopoda]|uniref:Uncharacterized protein n=2 Tax=Amborella trichopoda TaxID=13333 RepID=W1PN66_AMBTC|nr:hypothetical protein AMTR_s00014p00255380 [Amborella trichopoda]
MGSLASKVHAVILWVLIALTLFSTSYAGRHEEFMGKMEVKPCDNLEEMVKKSFHNEKISVAKPRMLGVNTNDYNTYDPAPALVKPPFKLIPN